MDHYTGTYKLLSERKTLIESEYGDEGHMAAVAAAVEAAAPPDTAGGIMTADEIEFEADLEDVLASPVSERRRRRRFRKARGGAMPAPSAGESLASSTTTASTEPGAQFSVSSDVQPVVMFPDMDYDQILGALNASAAVAPSGGVGGEAAPPAGSPWRRWWNKYRSRRRNNGTRDSSPASRGGAVEESSAAPVVIAVADNRLSPADTTATSSDLTTITGYTVPSTFPSTTTVPQSELRHRSTSTEEESSGELAENGSLVSGPVVGTSPSSDSYKDPTPDRTRPKVLASTGSVALAPEIRAFSIGSGAGPAFERWGGTKTGAGLQGRGSSGFRGFAYKPSLGRSSLVSRGLARRSGAARVLKFGPSAGNSTTSESSGGWEDGYGDLTATGLSTLSGVTPRGPGGPMMHSYSVTDAGGMSETVSSASDASQASTELPADASELINIQGIRSLDDMGVVPVMSLRYAFLENHRTSLKPPLSILYDIVRSLCALDAVFIIDRENWLMDVFDSIGTVRMEIGIYAMPATPFMEPCYTVLTDNVDSHFSDYNGFTKKFNRGLVAFGGYYETARPSGLSGRSRLESK